MVICQRDSTDGSNVEEDGARTDGTVEDVIPWMGKRQRQMVKVEESTAEDGYRRELDNCLD